MSIIDFLFGKFIEDEIFGRLSLDRMSSSRHWQGKTIFIPTGNEVDVYFSNLECSVPNELKQFYQELDSVDITI